MTNGENEFIEKARLSLEQRLERTPAHISSRLRAARHQVLDSHSRRKQPLWLPAMTTAALVAAIGVGVWFGYPAQKTTPAPELVAETVQRASDFEMLARGDDLELYEDLDFYLWLEQQEPDAV